MADRRNNGVKARSRVVAMVAGVALIGLAAGAVSAGTTPSALALMATQQPAGPAAALTPLTGGDGVFMGETPTGSLRKVGYAQHELAATGTATSYRAVGELTGDGRWNLEPDASAPYRTRVLVRAPAKAKDFSGNVVVEWLNVSGGVDANPEWVSLYEDIVRAGDAWVGVSAQRIGVEGGPVVVRVEGAAADVQGKGIKAIDPARYGSLEHPGDGFSFDIYTQVARALRAGDGLGRMRPKRMLAAGESQSAFALVTYFNGVQPRAKAFDGFFVHSRGAAGLPLVDPNEAADIAGSISGTPTIFRTDQNVPVIDIQSETDLTSILNAYSARQPDTKQFRLWEVAGTAHADAHLLGSNAKDLDCGVPINNGPMHIVAKAALRGLRTWVTTGKAPVKAPRIKTEAGAAPAIRRDADGIALGGIRTPPVDVPVSALSGVAGPEPSVICLLLGSSQPFAGARIADLYPSLGAYLGRYRARTDATIRAGFALRGDRAALLAFADPAAFAR